ncbi:BetR domain-containing protein [Leucobacter luti]|uniref:helix-turn-helix domain-containing protein n=1 Tax=Leucobacter luti TaxID=340320 RepID=UPI001048A41F|nr:helix-turn-helix domain-containing protein [Leucobacter luti]MCW2286992.1 lambda repressor-like predicted transcriptional regulator [Leucobacter luti]TCK41218.1 BetR domain-containing protein [Leucobacter luti]
MDQEIEAKIKSAMTDADRSRKWTARKAGMSESTFQRKLNGGGGWMVSELYRIAVALGIPPCELLPEPFIEAMQEAA